MDTVLATMTMSGSLGFTTGTERSPPPMRAAGRGSVVIFVHVAPASSERYRPTASGSLDATLAYSRLVLLGAIARFTWFTCAGRPFVIGVHVSPPSVDLNSPPPLPVHAAFSHGPWRCSHRFAYTTLGFVGSMSTSLPPVFSSRLSTSVNDWPPSVLL